MLTHQPSLDTLSPHVGCPECISLEGKNSHVENGDDDFAALVRHLNGDEANYLQGWRLHTTMAALCMAIFLASLEVSIVATALVAISSDLGSFDHGSWIVNSYMLTYTGFLIIWAKMSDIFGRKLLIVSSVVVFVIFSGACGAAQTTIQLIILRAFQGIGGAGTYSLTMVMLVELVPPHKIAAYTSYTSIVLAIAILLGPLLGGAITTYTSWRWIFLINVPAGVITAIALILAIPRGFPNHGKKAATRNKDPGPRLLSAQNIKRIDFVGTALLLAASIILVAGLEEAGLGHSWDSATLLCLIIVGALLWVVFFSWERRISLRQTPGSQEPIYPWRFCQSRVRVGLMLCTFLVGGSFTVCVIQLPQRFQSVNGLSPLDAGVRLLPLALASPLGTGAAATIAGKFKIPPVFILPVGAAIQILAFSLLSTLPARSAIFGGQYGYTFLAGLGLGMNLGCLFPMAPFTVEARDKSVAMSALVQFRTMGGSLCLAITASIFNGYVSRHLRDVLGAELTETVLKSVQELQALPQEQRTRTLEIFGAGYDIQFLILIGFAAAQIPAGLMMWRKEQIKI